MGRFHLKTNTKLAFDVTFKEAPVPKLEKMLPLGLSFSVKNKGLFTCFNFQKIFEEEFCHKI